MESFANSLDRALGDKSRAEIVGANGRKVAEEVFNVSVQSKRLSDFLMNNTK